MTEQGACLIIILNVRQALLALHLDSIAQVIVQAVKQRLPNALSNQQPSMSPQFEWLSMCHNYVHQLPFERVLSHTW